MKRYYLSFVCILIIICQDALAQDEFYTLAKKDTAASFYQLSLDDLYKINITTASNAKEALNKAPATILVVNEEEIRVRGYQEIFDVLNDLPGFDLSRAFGDDHYYLYARGYRKTLSDQMLFMVDGVIMNHLYNNNMDAFLQYPLYNVKQIEVVYGPASAVYGANAFSGVINIITKQDGTSSVYVSKGSANTNIVDINLSKKIDDLTITVSGRLYNSEGHDFSNRHALLTDTLFTSPQIWGPFQQTNFLGYQSPMNARFIYGTLNYKGLTIGAMSWFNESGLGSEFPADRVLNAGKWQFDEQTLYAKYETKIKKINSKTLFRMRQSGNPESSLFIARWDAGSKYASYWSTTNRAFSFFQDFSYKVTPQLSANFGLKHYYRILQRDYNINNGPNLANTDQTNYPLNDLPLPYRRIDGQSNHGTLQDQGAYIQLKFSPTKQVDIIGGMRFDYNSIWKEVVSPRVGVVVEPVQNLIAKAFYGTAFLEPSSRVLYGGWQGSLSNPNIQPERMQTFEASISYTKKFLAVGGSIYVNAGKDVISQVNSAPVNLGKNRMIGGELFAKFLYKPGLSVLERLKIDAYASFLNAEEAASDTTDFVQTGNMAPFKFHLILTASFAKRVDVSLQNRFVSAITTLESNPLGEIDAFFVSDANFILRDFPFKDFQLGLKVYNLFDVDYFHPGYRGASAGETLYDENNNFVGSQGWYNSRLPQPKRSAQVSLRVNF